MYGAASSMASSLRSRSAFATSVLPLTFCPVLWPRATGQRPVGLLDVVKARHGTQGKHPEHVHFRRARLRTTLSLKELLQGRAPLLAERIRIGERHLVCEALQLAGHEQGHGSSTPRGRDGL
eukprot:4349212-Prymnesium_polylepis.3